jgi:PglZ domain-containing protein
VTTSPPVVNRRIIESLLTKDLRRDGDRRLMLVHGHYDPSAPTGFSVAVDGTPREVWVTEQPSVLGIVEAWQDHQEKHPGDEVLVVTTEVTDDDLLWDLRGHAMRGCVRTVDRVDVVRDRFGAARVDPRIWRETWFIEALLDAEPPIGWPRVGSVLTRDGALRALIGVRLGDEFGVGALDAGALLAWSRTSGGPERFASLPPAERDGLMAWLTEMIGDTARVVMRLAVVGRAGEAMALGLLGTVATEPDAPSDALLSLGGLLGGLGAQRAELRTFTEAVQGTLERWATEAESGGRNTVELREQIQDIGQRADRLAADAGLADALAGNRFLPSGFQARLRTLAGALSPTPDATTTRSAEQALGVLLDHVLGRLYPERGLAAQMAVRLVRWLATPVAAVDSVAEAVSGHLADGGWVDRALTTLWSGDAVADPEVSRAYHAVYEAARSRREALDEQFSHRLATWTQHSATQAPAGCLLIEDVLDRIVLPLAGPQSPLVLVLDGMSSAVAVELGEQLTGRSWLEISPNADRRAAAVAAVPSVTRVSRASLLAGSLVVGDQPVEKDGFATFWHRHRRDAALFHKNEIAGGAGHRLAEPLIAALAGEGAVAVVLNTIDDALDHGREGERSTWRLSDITYLPELLDTARGYGRPVVLVADHGHIVEHTRAGRPTAAPGVESARWRTGTPDTGEVALTGPRVLQGGGSVVAAWREDIRYTLRKGGYHGGAALAEMTVPILTLVPTMDAMPNGWSVLEAETITPRWWHPPRTTEMPAPVPAVRKPSRGKARPHDDSTPLFSADELAAAGAVPQTTLGMRVVATDTYAAQRSRVPRAPNKIEIAAVIDALVDADGRLPVTTAAAKAGRAKRNPELVATTLQRLLNVEGYPILSVTDDGRTLRLDVGTLRVQFGLGPS